MTGLTFDAASHTYRFNGHEVPGVTSILAPLSDFSGVPRDVLDAASAFGTAVHLACELDDFGELDEAALDHALVPYLMAWRAFCRDHKTDWYEVEKTVFHESLRYAGTLDRLGIVDGGLSVVDIKTSDQLYPSVGPQLAAYAEASGNAHAQRIAVQLKGDGTYVFKHFNDPGDFPVFVSLLTVRNWCVRRSIKPTIKGPTNE